MAVCVCVLFVCVLSTQTLLHVFSMFLCGQREMFLQRRRRRRQQGHFPLPCYHLSCNWVNVAAATTTATLAAATATAITVAAATTVTNLSNNKKYNNDGTAIFSLYNNKSEKDG